jgi:hypothetical protein
MPKLDPTSLPRNYADIISIKNGYAQIDFEVFLLRHLNWRISLIDSSQIHEKLKHILTREEYSDIKKTYFFKYGILQPISIRDLRFYQKYIGIKGSYYHQLTDPLFVIKNEGEYILWEGYHRILQMIFNDQTTLTCYLLSL